ncbi:copper chaperone PCu(A)C [Deinococcus sp.]|uniref:copper chaperone PCu(A)C n=1 Tax=Deinococcus sp. TaxID=47478 RepID=UPI003C7C981A
MKAMFLKPALGVLTLGAGWTDAQMMQMPATNMAGMQMTGPTPAAISPAVKALKLVQGWVSAAPPGAEELSAYVELSNPGRVPLKLTGLSTSVSGQAMLMNTGKDAAGRESMQMAQSWNIPAGGRLKVLPGSGHLMLRQLRRQPQPGETVKVTLRFSDGSALPLTLPVKRFP